MAEFIFTAGEQLFFLDKQFKNDPKRCKPCKSAALRSGCSCRGCRSAQRGRRSRTHRDPHPVLRLCRIETTVPFKPTQGRPVLCRQCFQKRNSALAAQQAAAQQIAAQQAAAQPAMQPPLHAAAQSAATPPSDILSAVSPAGHHRGRAHRRLAKCQRRSPVPRSGDARLRLHGRVVA